MSAAGVLKENLLTLHMLMNRFWRTMAKRVSAYFVKYYHNVLGEYKG